MKRLIKEHKVFFLFMLLIITVIIFFCVHHFFNIANDKQIPEDSLAYYVLALFTSVILILLAYVKTEEAIEQSRTNYLLRIDERWSSAEIVRAREVIHKLYLDAKEAYPKYDNEQLKPIIAQAIMELNDNQDQIEQFIKLLNFLDFLETIGFLHYKKAITTEEVSELIGNSIIYFYDIFSIYIAYRRRTKDKGFYTKFENLYLEVKTKCVQKI